MGTDMVWSNFGGLLIFVGEVLVAIGVICAFLGGIYRFTIKKWIISIEKEHAQKIAEEHERLKQWNEAMGLVPLIGEQIESFSSRFSQVEEELSSIKKTVSQLKDEVLPNGGSSQRDAIDRIEEELALARGSQQMYLTELGIASWESNSSGQFLRVNRELCRITGRAPEELVGERWINFISPKQMSEFMASWQAAVKGQRDLARQLLEVNPPDGSRVVVRVNATAMFNKSGEFVGHTGFMRRAGKQQDDKHL